MVGTNTRCDGEFELLGFGQAFGGQVARMEAEKLTDQLLLSFEYNKCSRERREKLTGW